MSNELWAPVVALWQPVIEKLFEARRIIQVDRVPELGRSLVQEVNAVEVVVLRVPPKHRFPLADVDIGVGDAWNMLISQTLIQE